MTQNLCLSVTLSTFFNYLLRDKTSALLSTSSRNSSAIMSNAFHPLTRFSFSFSFFFFYYFILFYFIEKSDSWRVLNSTYPKKKKNCSSCSAFSSLRYSARAGFLCFFHHLYLFDFNKHSASARLGTKLLAYKDVISIC